MGFYYNFSVSYIVSSLVCFITEIAFPSIRTNEITRSKIIKNYQIMLPTVAANIAIAYPYFLVLENTLTFDTIIVLHTFNLLDIIYWNLLFMSYFILWALITDVLFYTVHSLMHTPKLYWLHAKHHSFRYTHGIGAIYSSVFEFIVGNLGVASIPIYLLSIPKNYVAIIISFMSAYTVIISHSGFRYFDNHLTHHLKYKVNYGLVFMDRLCGTRHKKVIAESS